MKLLALVTVFVLKYKSGLHITNYKTNLRQETVTGQSPN
jgi:hypothetical protein